MTALYVRVPSAQAKLLDQVALSTGRSKQQIVSESLESVLGADTRSRPANEIEVLTLEEVASLLGVTAGDVAASIDADSLPGRRIGDKWRFSKAAVLLWLGTSGGTGRRPPGFAVNRGARD